MANARAEDETAGTEKQTMPSMTQDLVITACWIVLYFVSSSALSISNKLVVHDLEVSPSQLAAAQTTVSLCLDFAAVLVASPLVGPDKRVHSSLEQGVFVVGGRVVRLVEEGSSLLGTLRDLFPVAVCLVLGKLSTLMSYQMVSVSLAHAAKSLEPVLNVALTFLLFRELQPLRVNVALIPVVIGVFLASSGEASYNHTGFILAASSAAFRVLEKIVIKKVMVGRTLGFFQMHLAVGILTTAVIVLCAVVEALAGAASSGASSKGPEAPWGVVAARFMGSSIMGYVSSIASYAILTMMSHLSFTVVNTMKRLATMSASIAFFGSSITFFNGLGLLVAVFGAMAYSLIKHPIKPHSKPDGTPDSVSAGALREDPLDATDAERAMHDPDFEADIVRTTV